MIAGCGGRTGSVSKKHCASCLGALLLAAMLSANRTTTALGQGSQPSEYQLKAAFLFNFAKFIDWPDESFAGPQAQFTVCVLGQDPFGHALEDSLAGKSVGNHVVEVDRFPYTANLSSPRRCQIAFVSSSERQHYREVISYFHGASVLLVGDADGFAASGGSVEFMIEDSRIRFAINPEAADRANLKISSKLLALAKIVREDAVKGKG
jgi:hypothetical protein